jgi:hypothetical protein
MTAFGEISALSQYLLVHVNALRQLQTYRQELVLVSSSSSSFLSA